MVALISPATKPENLYRTVEDPAERRRIQATVVADCRGRVASLVRRTVSQREHWAEAEQVGVIGILVALEKYDPERLGEDRGAAFWCFAFPHVRNEIQRWIDCGVRWRPRSKKAPGHSEQKRAKGSGVSLVPDFDALVSTGPSVEDEVGNTEAAARLESFADSLNSDDREVLFSENSKRVRSRRYLSLVERAAAFVKGVDADGRAEETDR